MRRAPLALALIAAGCGATVQVNPQGDGGSAPPVVDGASGGSDQAACAQSDCPMAGATRCIGPLVETCHDTGGGCLGWSAAAACPNGQTCSTDACVDPCLAAGLMAACTEAAGVVTACCKGTMPMADPVALCHSFIAAGKDPMQACGAWTINTTCPEVVATLAAAGSCCCDFDETCDPQQGNACVITCSTKTNCDGAPGGSTCAPLSDGQRITGQAMVCRPDDGKPYDGCDFPTAGCDNPFECWKDRTGNEVCTKSCFSDADCGNPGVACCNHQATCSKVIGACAGTGACMPCP